MCRRHCQKRHNTLLHVFNQNEPTQNLGAGSESLGDSCTCNVAGKIVENNEYNEPLSTHSNTDTNVEQFQVVRSSNNLMNVDNVKCVLLPVVAVNVNCRLDTVALLDTASTHSFVKRSLVDKLSLKGTKTKLSLSTMNHESETSTQFFRLKV